MSKCEKAVYITWRSYAVCENCGRTEAQHASKGKAKGSAGERSVSKLSVRLAGSVLNALSRVAGRPGWP